MNYGSRSLLHFILLMALCGALFWVYLGQSPFFDKGEPREALAVQDILLRGDWLFPLKRATDFPSKPPLFHWSAALFSRITGHISEFTVRFPSAFYATLGVLVLYISGSSLFGSQIAFVGGAILATTLVYESAAITARVDMTLNFFVLVTLAFFYALHRGFLSGSSWFYAFYGLLGVGALAKGPLGILLPCLVIGIFLALKKRWDVLFHICLHPGVALTLILGLGWYVIAATKGGEDFFTRQIIEENLARFFGGSGHSHPIYYYIPYMFAEGLPWSLFLPFPVLDSLKKDSSSDEHALFLKLWILVMFVFFSLSAGKRPVYLLPIYPALSLLMAAWFYQPHVTSKTRAMFYRLLAAVFCLMGLLLLAAALLSLWSHNSSWLLSSLEPVLKPKDLVKLLIVKDALDRSRWNFAVTLFLSSLLWLSLAYNLWFYRIRCLPSRLVLLSALSGIFAQGVAVPAIAEANSYRSFMYEVNRCVAPEDNLYTYGGSFNSDSLVFYRGRPIPNLNQRPEVVAEKIGGSNHYVIMGKKEWEWIHKVDASVQPLFRSEGSGPEGDAPLVLVGARELSQTNGKKLNCHFAGDDGSNLWSDLK